MSRRRDHHRDYQRRVELARSRGFASLRQQRAAPRQVRTLAELLALPAPARQARTAALRVVRTARTDRISIEAASAAEGVSVSAVRWWAGPALRLAIASKGYALYRPTAGGPRLIAVGDWAEEAGAASEAGDSGEPDPFVDWSEHGLGVYLDPTDEQRRDRQGRREWIRQAWQWILTTALTGSRPPLPGWADRPALCQFSVSGPGQAGWFQLPDTGGPQAGKPRPFGFCLLGQTHPLAGRDGERAHPAAPFEKDPRRWPQLRWYDRHTGQPLRTAPAGVAEDPERLSDAIRDGLIPLRTIGQVLTRYTNRPEHKSLQPDGTPAGENTTGQLQRRPSRSGPPITALIGKEGKPAARTRHRRNHRPDRLPHHLHPRQPAVANPRPASPPRHPRHGRHQRAGRGPGHQRPASPQLARRTRHAARRGHPQPATHRAVHGRVGTPPARRCRRKSAG